MPGSSLLALVGFLLDMHSMHPTHMKSHSNTWIRVGGYTLKHDRCSSITERAINNIGVSCDPANISHTCKDVLLWVVVKCILNGEEEDARERERERERAFSQ